MPTSDSLDSICITTSDFKKYMYLLLLLLLYILYILYNGNTCKEKMSNVDLNSTLSTNELKDKIIKLQEQLYTIQMNEQRCQADLFKTSQLLKQNSTQTTSNLNKLTNPLSPPDRIYTSSSNNNSFQLVGYIYKDNDRYQLFGKYREPGRSDKWDYYIIDQNRQSLKIPFTTKNYNEIYDGDTVNIPTLGDNFITKIYELEQIKYNPNL